MPFEKFEAVRAIDNERRKAIAKSIRIISVEELRKLGEEMFDEPDRPWRQTRLEIKIEPTPFAASSRTQRSAISPAPMTMIDCRDISPRVFSTSSSAALLIETAPRPIPVAVRISFAV